MVHISLNKLSGAIQYITPHIHPQLNPRNKHSTARFRKIDSIHASQLPSFGVAFGFSMCLHAALHSLKKCKCCLYFIISVEKCVETAANMNQSSFIRHNRYFVCPIRFSPFRTESALSIILLCYRINILC
jgi:hypothetical protein